jgi:hypothetical protein
LPDGNVTALMEIIAILSTGYDAATLMSEQSGSAKEISE